LRDLAQERFETLFGPEFGHGKLLDLTAMRAALDALGGPQAQLAPVIHVAGTNGKGSTIAFMRAIAEAAGLEVHAFTKPHLLKLSERFVVAGRQASETVLTSVAERIAASAPQLTQFDAQVAAAILLFGESPADLVLLETGMGGRDDSTNVIAAPALSVITPISLDHQDALGDRLEDIAAHKAGILRPGVRAVIARQPDRARAMIEARAAQIGAPLFQQGIAWDAFASAGRLVVQTQVRALDLPLPKLHGAHQIDNAGLACAALLTWRDDWSEDAFAQGVLGANWPGRLQPLTRGALSAPIRAIGGEVWVDVGHNADAASALAHALRSMQAKRQAPAIAIVGMRARKDADTFVGALAGAVDHMIAAPLSQAHIAPAMIRQIADMMGVNASEAPSLAAAMQNAAQFPAPRVLICGSFLLAAEALEAENA
jgi:dihydrofolate synthase/folylpolyglutamate synthase